MVANEETISAADPVPPKPALILWLALGVSGASFLFFLGASYLILVHSSWLDGAAGSLIIAITTGMCAIFQYRALLLRKSLSAVLASIIHGLIGCFALGMVLVYVIEPWWKNNSYDALGPPIFWLIFIPAWLCVALVSLRVAWVYRRRATSIEVFESQFKRCSQCSYDLRGSIWAKSDLCPECGTRIPIAWRWSERPPLNRPHTKTMLPHSAKPRE
jgi:hypothetical protein